MDAISLTAPTSWSHLSAQQLRYVSWLMTQKNISREELLTRCFVRFTKIKIKHEKNGYYLCICPKGKYFTLQGSQVLSLIRKLEYLVKRVEEITPLPRLANLTHVDPRLYNTPFVQYLACENYYQAFIYTRDIWQLRYLAACFYTSGKEFNDSETIRKAKRFKQTPYHVLYTVFLWFYGLKGLFAERFPNFFRKVDYIIEEEPSAPNMRLQIQNIVRALTGGDVTKSAEIYRVETWEALAELDAKAREYAEMEARLKSKKTK
ncbi:MAG: hypothetical protein LBF79_05655 [Dysgonamonadaceae bacterium]|jgi:hypothetical protein|nr:hypothetical protein [Dysgonamonadaceae bacterium]